LQGENETLGRDALIQVLLDDKPIPQKIREALADLFSEEENRDDRRLILKFRSKNSGDISGKDRFITVFVGKELRRLGGKKEAAVESAVKKLALSDRRFLMP
jgi:hypothetical protein